MMSEISITITTPDGLEDPQAFAGELALAVGQALLGGVGSAPGAAPVSVVQESATPPVQEVQTYAGPEGATALKQLIGEIAPNTRIVLRTIAEASIDGDGIHSVELRERLGLGSPSALAGVVTSLGFAERRTGLPKPYTQGWAQHNGVWGNKYVMQPEIARTILELVAADSGVQTP
jgi:hypothetical protein